MRYRTANRPVSRFLPVAVFLFVSLQLVGLRATANAQETCNRGVRHPGYNSRLLMNSIEDGHQEETWQLLREGADLESEDGRKFGVTPLLTAVLHQRRDIVRMLLECGADVNHANDEGFTPLILASVRNTGATLERLLDAGADLTARTDSGIAALDMAVRCVQPKNVEALLALEGASSLSADDVSRALADAKQLRQTAATVTLSRHAASEADHMELIPASAETSFNDLCSSPVRDVEGLAAIVAMLESGAR